LIIGISILLLVMLGPLTNQIPLRIHPDGFTNNLLKYQIFALLIGFLTTITTLALNPESKQFLKVGQLRVLPEKEKWLGINGKSSWTSDGLQLLFVISTMTGVFMFFAVKYTDSIYNFRWSYIPLILVLSLTNSLSEELIFRFGVIGGLSKHYPKPTLLIISAVLFGLPHYFGNPGGVVGIFMSGALGYILCKATIETKGMGIAWSIHFVQDVIIFTALMMINIR
jgi:membrane protease YdiL (CAAX protease family)